MKDIYEYINLVAKRHNPTTAKIGGSQKKSRERRHKISCSIAKYQIYTNGEVNIKQDKTLPPQKDFGKV